LEHSFTYKSRGSNRCAVAFITLFSYFLNLFVPFSQRGIFHGRARHDGES
jgi:hypothetical protein